MARRRSFRPEFLEGLEERKVMSAGVGSISTTTATLQQPAEKFVKGQSPSVVSLVNASFAAFSRDYSASRAVYFASIQARTAALDVGSTNPGTDESAGDLAAIQQYTQQRVDLLAQQLRNNFQQSSLYTKKDRENKSDPLAIITKKINAEATGSKIPYNKGTLGRALYQATPSPTASSTAIALNSLAQDNAIESARVAIINGINSIKVQSAKKH